jgi:hypothetical protein
MRCYFVCIAACVLAGLSFAADGPKEEPNVDELIRRLGDRRLAEAASKAIEALGPEALPALRNAKDDPDPDIRTQVANLIPKAIIAPQKITLHLKQRPLREALEAIVKQAGYQLKIQAPSPGFPFRSSVIDSERASEPFDFDFEGVPFWIAWDTVCSRSHLVDDPLCKEPSTVGLVFWDGPAPYIHHQGAFRFMANHFEYQLLVRRKVSLEPMPGMAEPNNLSMESLHLTFIVEAEPRLHIVSATLAEVAVAYDDRNPLVWPLPRRVVRQGQDNNSKLVLPRDFGHVTGKSSDRPRRVTLTIEIGPPPPNASTVREVKGTVALKIGTEHNVRVISDDIMSAKGAKCTVNKTTIEITEVRKTSLGCDIRYVLTGDRFNTPALELSDAQGNRFSCRSSLNRLNGECRLEVVPANVRPTGEPAKLSWTWWDSIECRVPFGFRNLALQGISRQAPAK